MTSIGIVGAGFAGLQLALHLQQHDIAVTLYTDRSAEQLRHSKLPNTPALFPRTMERLRALGVDRWTGSVPDFTYVTLSITGTPIGFNGYLKDGEAACFLDPRMFSAALLEDFEARGGQIVIGALTAEDVTRLSGLHDLMVVASGRGSLIDLFTPRPELSPYDAPQRILMAGLFNGINKPSPNNMFFVISPGHGEIFHATVNTFEGQKTNLLIEGIPGQGFDIMTQIRYEDDPEAFRQAVMEVLRVHAPHIYATIDPETFGPVSPNDVIQGAVRPVVRKAYADLGNGKFALAVGDVHVSNDPIVGQGANAASHNAAVVAEAILKAVRFDETFCAEVETEMMAYTESVTAWSNAFLQPPPEHAIGLMGAATQMQSVANAFAQGFTDPVKMWYVLSNPQHTAEFIQQNAEMMPV